MDLDTLTPSNRDLLNQNTIMSILTDYMKGTSLKESCELNKMELHTFLITLKDNPLLVDIFRDSREIHKAAVKELLTAVVMNKAITDKDVETAKWLLTKLYDEFKPTLHQITTKKEDIPARNIIDITQYVREDSDAKE